MRYSTCPPVHSLRRLREARPCSLFAGRLATLAALFAAAGGFAFAQSVTPSAQAAPDDDENTEVVVLPEFAVSTSTGDGAIRADETLGALRTSTLLIESPITVSVLTPEFVEAFMLDSEHDQVSFVAGGSALGEWQTGAGSAYLRGFNTGYFRNGFARWGYNATVNVERVEYIKGPLAATFGRSAPGGVINYITKRAQRKPAYSLYFNTGSYGYENVQMSATGPVSKNLFYRVDFEYRDVGGV